MLVLGDVCSTGRALPLAYRFAMRVPVAAVCCFCVLVSVVCGAPDDVHVQVRTAAGAVVEASAAAVATANTGHIDDGDARTRLTCSLSSVVVAMASGPDARNNAFAAAEVAAREPRPCDVDDDSAGRSRTAGADAATDNWEQWRRAWRERGTLSDSSVTVELGQAEAIVDNGSGVVAVTAIAKTVASVTIREGVPAGEQSGATLAELSLRGGAKSARTLTDVVDPETCRSQTTTIVALSFAVAALAVVVVCCCMSREALITALEDAYGVQSAHTGSDEDLSQWNPMTIAARLRHTLSPPPLPDEAKPGYSKSSLRPPAAMGLSVDTRAIPVAPRQRPGVRVTTHDFPPRPTYPPPKHPPQGAHGT